MNAGWVKRQTNGYYVITEAGRIAYATIRGNSNDRRTSSSD